MELGPGELLVILAIVMLLFGPSKLPKLGQGLGSAMANFRKGLRGDDERTALPGAAREPTAVPTDAPTVSATPEAAEPVEGRA
jgi:sec-independent protein translocase protein TatA